MNQDNLTDLMNFAESLEADSQKLKDCLYASEEDIDDILLLAHMNLESTIENFRSLINYLEEKTILDEIAKLANEKSG